MAAKLLWAGAASAFLAPLPLAPHHVNRPAPRRYESAEAVDGDDFMMGALPRGWDRASAAPPRARRGAAPRARAAFFFGPRRGGRDLEAAREPVDASGGGAVVEGGPRPRRGLPRGYSEGSSRARGRPRSGGAPPPRASGDASAVASR